MTTLESITAQVAHHFGLTYSQILGTNRQQEVADARAVAMELAAEAGCDRKEMEEHFRRTRTAFIYARKKVANMASVYPSFSHHLTTLREKIKK